MISLKSSTYRALISQLPPGSYQEAIETQLPGVLAMTIAMFLGHDPVLQIPAGLVSGWILSSAIERAGGIIQAAKWIGGMLARSPAVSVSGLIALAALLAGRKRPALCDEWRAHLAGESGHDPLTWTKVRQALGFVASAVQYRLADAAAMAWRPADAVLGSRFLSNLFVWGPVIAVLVAIVHHDGRFGLVADDQDPAALGAFLYGVIRTGRWWRGVKPPEPKVRRAEK